MVKKKAVPKLPQITRLGKIQSAEFGFIPPDNGMVGIKLILGGSGWGINVEDVAPNHALLKEGEVPDWSDEEYEIACKVIIRTISYVLADCAKDNLSAIVGTPVEVITQGSKLIHWRVLKEVL